MRIRARLASFILSLCLLISADAVAQGYDNVAFFIYQHSGMSSNLFPETFEDCAVKRKEYSRDLARLLERYHELSARAWEAYKQAAASGAGSGGYGRQQALEADAKFVRGLYDKLSQKARADNKRCIDRVTALMREKQARQLQDRAKRGVTPRESLGTAGGVVAGGALDGLASYRENFGLKVSRRGETVRLPSTASHLRAVQGLARISEIVSAYRDSQSARINRLPILGARDTFGRLRSNPLSRLMVDASLGMTLDTIGNLLQDVDHAFDSFDAGTHKNLAGIIDEVRIARADREGAVDGSYQQLDPELAQELNQLYERVEAVQTQMANQYADFSNQHGNTTSYVSDGLAEDFSESVAAASDLREGRAQASQDAIAQAAAEQRRLAEAEFQRQQQEMAALEAQERARREAEAARNRGCSQQFWAKVRAAADRLPDTYRPPICITIVGENDNCIRRYKPGKKIEEILRKSPDIRTDVESSCNSFINSYNDAIKCGNLLCKQLGRDLSF